MACNKHLFEHNIMDVPSHLPTTAERLTMNRMTPVHITKPLQDDALPEQVHLPLSSFRPKIIDHG